MFKLNGTLFMMFKNAALPVPTGRGLIIDDYGNQQRAGQDPRLMRSSTGHFWYPLNVEGLVDQFTGYADNVSEAINQYEQIGQGWDAECPLEIRLTDTRFGVEPYANGYAVRNMGTNQLDGYIYSMAEAHEAADNYMAHPALFEHTCGIAWAE
jgi:hypothetical protein